MKTPLQIALVALLPTSAGCDPGCEERPCPKAFDVAAWCEDTSSCTGDTGAARCDVSGCFLAVGETITIPIQEFAGELGSRTQLLLQPLNVSSPDFDIRGVDVALDGVAGTYVLGRVGWAPTPSVQWDPFPGAPMIMTIRYMTGPEPNVQLRTWFHDFECERIHPEPDCRE